MSAVLCCDFGSSVSGDNQVLNELQLLFGPVEAAKDNLMVRNELCPVVVHRAHGLDRLKYFLLEDVAVPTLHLPVHFDSLLELGLLHNALITNFVQDVAA